MSIIEQSRDEYGLNRCLQALGVAKSSWHYRQKGSGRRGAKEKEMESEMRHILVDHPDYGRPRMTIELRERLGYAVNHKRVGRLLQDNGWGLIRNLPKRKESGVSQVLHRRRGKLDKVRGLEFEVFKAFSTDFAELRYGQGGQKACLMTLSDLESSWAAGSPALWSITTRTRSLPAMLGVEISFSENGARGNPWIESLWGRMKVESESLIHQAQTLEQLQQTIDERFEYYNRWRRHSSIGYKRPQEYAKGKLKTGENIDPDS